MTKSYVSLDRMAEPPAGSRGRAFRRSMEIAYLPLF